MHLFSRKIHYEGGESCFLQLQLPLLQELAAPRIHDEHCCPGKRLETLTWARRRPREAEDILLFTQDIKAAQLLGNLAAFLLHLYFTCGTDRVNDNKKSFHLKIGKERCFSLNKEKQFSRFFLNDSPGWSNLLGHSICTTVTFFIRKRLFLPLFLL